MKKVMSAVCAAALVGGVLSGVALAKPSTGHYLALGDSLAAGVGASNEEHTGYVPRFFNKYVRGGMAGPDALTNLAVSGETSGSYLSQGQHQQALATINDENDVTVVTLDIGGNDFLDLLEPGGACAPDPTSAVCQLAVVQTLRQLAANMSVILPETAAALAADPGDERFVVMTYYNQLGGTGHPLEPIVDSVLLGPDGMVDCGAPAATWGVNDIITCIALASGAEVVDLYGPFGDDAQALTHIGAGDFHPSQDGHKLIADLLGAGQ